MCLTLVLYPSTACPSMTRVLGYDIYRQTCNISHTLICDKIVDHSVVGASPVSAAPKASSFSTLRLSSVFCTNANARRDEKHSNFGNRCHLYYIFYGIYNIYNENPEVCLYSIVVYMWSHIGIRKPYGDMSQQWLGTMACHMRAPSHYLNQCWLIIS